MFKDWIFYFILAINGGFLLFSSVENNTLTLKKYLARHFVIGFDGPVLDEAIVKYITHYPPAGIILFDRNIQSPEQVKTLIHDLKFTVKVPLIVMVDQEGGRVARMGPKNGFLTETPSAECLGQESLFKSYEAGLQQGQLLKSVGVDLNLAPVVDLTIPGGYIGQRTRSFSKDPQTVVDHAQSFIDGLHHAGVKSCLKHFPGHGSGQIDPHQYWTDVSKTYQSKEIIPFEKCIHNGYADSILVGHLFNTDWDQEHPASFSHAVVTQLLRNQLQYQGLILTDDLDMDAAGKKPEDLILLSLKAGADLLLLCNTGAGYRSYMNNTEWSAALENYLDSNVKKIQQDPELEALLIKDNKLLEQRINTLLSN